MMLEVFASTFFGICVGGLFWGFTSILLLPRNRSGLGTFEIERRQTLVKQDLTYRFFEPLVDEWAALLRTDHPRQDRLSADLKRLPSAPPWKANEFLAVRQIQGAFMGSVFGLVTYPFLGIAGLAISTIVSTFGWQTLSVLQLQETASKRILSIKKRFPYAIDLIALVMEAGGGFQDALATVTEDLKGEPLGEELEQVLIDIELGSERNEAVKQFGERVNDVDIQETAFAIIKGWELGSPMADIFREQAIQMRQRRSQWAEKAAANAQVNIVFPGMVIMIGCLIVVLTPILLKAYARFYAG